MYFPILIPNFQYCRPLDPKFYTPRQSHEYVQNCDLFRYRHLFLQLTSQPSEAPQIPIICVTDQQLKRSELVEGSSHMMRIHQ